MAVGIDQDKIIEIASTVWSSFLGMTLSAPESSESPIEDGGQTMTATVHISGGWNGSVILSGSTTLARRAAAAMFQIAADDLDDEEVADAFGELVNTIGGNLKSLLSEPSQLSLPSVSQGAAHVVTIPGARLLEYVELACDDDRLQVAVWNRREDKRTDQHVELERTI
jgi:chemotaxis protein CheX